MSVTILMYHEIARQEQLGDLTRLINPQYVTIDRNFEEHLALFDRINVTVVGLDDVAAWLRGDVELPERTVVITFDDGFAGNHKLALPSLVKAGREATFFVVTNRIDDPMMLSATQMLEMHQEGMTIGSHTCSHPLLSTLGQLETRAELSVSKEFLEERLNRAVRHISLPNGDSNEWFRQAAHDAGYVTACGSDFGRNSRAADPLYLNRIIVKQSTSADDIEAYVTGRWSVFAANMAKSLAKQALVSLLTKRRYDALYNRVNGVDEQRKGDAL